MLFHLLGGAAVLCAVHAPAQAVSGSLPPTMPTSAAVAPLAATAQAEGAGGMLHGARVSCTGGMLEVHADRASLRGVLQEIARCTGMRIEGSVPSGRVYGDYGPAAPATVLATLIDGTGTNMLLQETNADQPLVLVLTRRVGGPTPAPEPEDTDSAAPAAQAPPAAYQAAVPSPAVGGRPGLPAGAATGVPTTQQPGVATGSLPPGNNGNVTPDPTPIQDEPPPPPPGSDTARAASGAAPGSVSTDTAGQAATSPGAGSPSGSTDLTPEQIFQQLQQRMQQQRQQQQREAQQSQ